MRISSAFPSAYLKSADLPEGPGVTVRIADVKIEDVSGNGEMKPVAYFIGKQRGLVMNKTNSLAVSSVYGDETENWHGKPITIFRSKVQYQGSLVDCLRVMVPQQGAPAQSQPQQQQQPAPPEHTPQQQQAAENFDNAMNDPSNQAADSDIPW